MSNVESFKIELEQEDDGRWIGEIVASCCLSESMRLDDLKNESKLDFRCVETYKR